MDRLLLRVPEVATRLSMSRGKVYELIRTDALPSVRIDRSRRVRVRDLEAFVGSLGAGGPDGQAGDGVIKRRATWSYVVRVADPRTGVTRPRWVSGFTTEAAAKSARDEARRKARRGEYVDRSAITVAEYLSGWLTAHSLETKPKTLAGYRWLIDRYVIPRLGGSRVQAVRPSDVSTLYRELLDGGGRDWRPLSSRTVDAVHRVLRKALNDAVTSEQLLESNPVVRAKRPRSARVELDELWTPAQLGRFLEFAKSHRMAAFFHMPRSPALVAATCST